MKFVCSVCNYVYDPDVGDPESGVEPTTDFERLPEDWVCPDCETGRFRFLPSEEQRV
jgi:rubredoxin